MIKESVGIGSKRFFQNEISNAGPENNDARFVFADTIGTYLHEMRLKCNIGLEEVSEATGISIGVLKTLENNDRKQFPAEIYIKAFYKKCAEYLGLDPEETFTAYQQQSQKRSKTRGRFNFSTVVTLKGYGESLSVEIARRLFVPILLVLGTVLLCWIYKNFLAPYNPIVLFR